MKPVNPDSSTCRQMVPMGRNRQTVGEWNESGLNQSVQLIVGSARD